MLTRYKKNKNTDIFKMPSKSKRDRETSQSSIQENVMKTPRLSDSSFKYLQLLDKRLEKQTEDITNMLEEFKSRIFAEISKTMDEVKNDLIELKQRVNKLDTAVDDVVSMKKEIKLLKSKILSHENSVVASDIRITGVPFDENSTENLSEFFNNLCDAIQIEPPEIKSIFRVKNFTNYRNVPDPPILVRLNTPYDKNFVLKKCADFKRLNKTNFCLKDIGIDSDEIFYVNENLTPFNYKIFKTAIGLKNKNLIQAARSIRGIVHIKRINCKEFLPINDLEELNQFFRNVGGSD